MYEPIGYYTDCDDAYCSACFERVFGPNGERWEGFEGWTEPLVITAGEESDTPTHCHACETLIPHDLTSEGYEYVGEYLANGTAGSGGRLCILRQWWAEYGDGLDESILRNVLDNLIHQWPLSDEYTPSSGWQPG